ncbi:hypothetical protein [uncultured Eubacterium sp.]|mgnify:FL=1|uniref:hypothetical protein n=1 Tax=uncultured Eubacterium sp. TaxID=165185 RepID=UPI00326353FD
MNIISKKKQGVIAIICAIAMVVTSLTIYNPREAKADTDYSQLTYDYKNKGEAYMKGAETTKSQWRVAVDTSQSTGDIVNWMTTGDGNLNFYGEMFMNVTWHGVYPDATLEINGVKVEKGAEGVQVYAAAEIHVNAKNWINNNAYNVVKVTSADETQYVTFIVATGNKVDTSTEESTELQKPAAPTGLVANINDLKTNYTIAFANVATATSYKFYLDGKFVKDITNGGVVTIEELKLEEGKTYTFGVSAVNAAGESDISTVSVTVPSKETETTKGSEETTETFDPSTITEWTAVGGSTTMSYYIANDAAGKVSVKPEMHGDSLYAAFALAAKFKSVVLNDESITPRGGADVEIAKTSFKEGYNKLVVTDFYGKESVTIYFKVEKEEETTTKPYKDGEVLVNDSNVTKEVPAYENGDYWQNEYNNAPVNYVKGKKYVAEVVVSSTAAKKIKLVFQRVNIWDFVDANSGYEAEIAAGNKVKITYVFEATQETDNGNFDIYLGSVADATTLVFESKKLTTYNEVPAGVQTGVEVVSAPATYTVTVDGTPTSVTEGSTYTFGDNAQGYYDTTNSVAYASGETITVNSNITVTSINLNVAMQKGASVRLATPTGLRFQTVITSGNDIAVSDILNKDFVTTGTLITTFDLFSANGNVLDKDSKYTNLDIANSGWYNDEVGKFCGSIIKIKTGNYEKKFVGVGYATITYHNGDKYSIYADVNETDNARSIYYVANAVKDAGYKNCDAAQKAIIDKYLAKEAF